MSRQTALRAAQLRRAQDDERRLGGHKRPAAGGGPGGADAKRGKPNPAAYPAAAYTPQPGYDPAAYQQWYGQAYQQSYAAQPYYGQQYSYGY